MYKCDCYEIKILQTKKLLIFVRLLELRMLIAFIEKEF